MSDANLYVLDTAKRARVEAAADEAGIGITEEGGDLIVVDLGDENAMAMYLADEPEAKAVGFYPTDHEELAEEAWSHGIEPFPEDAFFEDPVAILESAVP